MSNSLCEELKIAGYPTLRLFLSSTVAGVDYMGDRTAADMQRFLSEHISGQAADTTAWAFSGDVKHLDTEGLEAVVAGPTRALVMFYGAYPRLLC